MPGSPALCFDAQAKGKLRSEKYTKDQEYQFYNNILDKVNCVSFMISTKKIGMKLRNSPFACWQKATLKEENVFLFLSNQCCCKDCVLVLKGDIKQTTPIQKNGFNLNQSVVEHTTLLWADPGIQMFFWFMPWLSLSSHLILSTANYSCRWLRLYFTMHRILMY